MAAQLSSQYSITVRLEYPHAAGWIANIASVIAGQGGEVQAVDIVDIQRGLSIRDYTIECASTDAAEKIVDALRDVDGVHVRSASDDTFRMHLGGKLEVSPRVQIKTRADLSMAYTPGVARICESIYEDSRRSFNLTIRKNCIAIISNGTAILGLGDLGPEAAMPVMEGKAILFKEFAEVDAFPLCIDAKSAEEVIQFCKQVAPTFGGINLEDIAAPECFEIEEQLKEELEIPVFHDDQHGTAIVVLAATMNALKITNRKKEQVKVVICGAGAAGIACAKILKRYGIDEIIICDSKGAISSNTTVNGNTAKQWAKENTNPNNESGSVQQVLKDADMFLGLSRPNIIDKSDVLSMKPKPIVFALSNPNPEIAPEKLLDTDAVLATGRSDYPNQINNVLAFPGIFRGALDVSASDVNEEMKLAAAMAIADVIPEENLSTDYFIPSIFNRKVSKLVAAAVAKAAKKSGVARRVPKASGVTHK